MRSQGSCKDKVTYGVSGNPGRDVSLFDAENLTPKILLDSRRKLAFTVKMSPIKASTVMEAILIGDLIRIIFGYTIPVALRPFKEEVRWFTLVRDIF